MVDVDLVDVDLVGTALEAPLAFAVRDFVALVARREADLRRVEEEREAMKFNPSDVFRRKVGFFVTASAQRSGILMTSLKSALIGIGESAPIRNR